MSPSNLSVFIFFEGFNRKNIMGLTFILKGLFANLIMDKTEDLVTTLIEKGKTKKSFRGVEDTNLRKIIANFLNEKIDLPYIDEKAEGKLFQALVSIFAGFVFNKLPR